MIAAKLISKPVFSTLQKHINPRWLMVMIFPILILNAWLVIKALQYFQPLVAIVILAALLGCVLKALPPPNPPELGGFRTTQSPPELGDLGGNAARITQPPKLLKHALAFILNYPVQFLQQHGNRHSIAVVIVFLLTFVKDTLHELRNASVDTVIGLEAPATSDHSPLEKQQVQQL